MEPWDFQMQERCYQRLSDPNLFLANEHFKLKFQTLDYWIVVHA